MTEAAGLLGWLGLGAAGMRSKPPHPHTKRAHQGKVQSAVGVRRARKWQERIYRMLVCEELA